MLIAVLNGDMTVSELAQARGGEASVLVKLFDMELKHLDLTFSALVGMSIWHQLSVADMLRMSGKV